MPANARFPDAAFSPQAPRGRGPGMRLAAIMTAPQVKRLSSMLSISAWPTTKQPVSPRHSIATQSSLANTRKPPRQGSSCSPKASSSSSTKPHSMTMKWPPGEHRRHGGVSASEDLNRIAHGCRLELPFRAFEGHRVPRSTHTASRNGTVIRSAVQMAAVTLPVRAAERPEVLSGRWQYPPSAMCSAQVTAPCLRLCQTPQLHAYHSSDPHGQAICCKRRLHPSQPHRGIQILASR